MAAVAALVLAVGVLGAATASARLPVARDRKWLRFVPGLAGAALLVVVGMPSASHASPARPAPKASGLAILFASSWDGSPEIFAADPEGRRPVGQVTFAPGLGSDEPLGTPEPLPSLDGRKLVYCDRSCDDASRLWVTNADGSGARKIIDIDCCVGPVAWSPDSRRFAYLCCVDPTSPARGLHVVSADGSTDRIVNSYARYDYGDTIVWSSDGRYVHVAASTAETRSPDGRWTTHRVAGTSGCTAFCPMEQIEVDNAGGRAVDFLNVFIGGTAWSPDSRLLAYVTTGGISVLDPGSRKSRLLSHDLGSRLAWSPDGRLLAYTQGPQYANPGDLRTVTLHGHVHVVVAANGPYGGPIFAFAWTRVPNGVRYRAPSPVRGVFTDWPVRALAADGDRVAYATCAGVFTWDTTGAEASQVAKPTARIFSAPGIDNCTLPRELVSSIALAGDRLAYVDGIGANVISWSAVGVSIGPTPEPFVLASGSYTNGPPPPRVAGSGGLLALATRDINPPTPSSLLWHIQTVGPTGCPCQEILHFADARQDGHLDDVDQDRLVVSGSSLLRILDANGSLLLTLPLEPSHAALSGDDLVVQLGNEIRHYSAATGTLLHSWQLAPSTEPCPYCPGSNLQDVARGLAAYTADRQLHLLRLSDGTDTIVGPAYLARFADTGLVLAGTRIQLIPYGDLPLH